MDETACPKASADAPSKCLLARRRRNIRLIYRKRLGAIGYIGADSFGFTGRNAVRETDHFRAFLSTPSITMEFPTP
jgi:hypothetical protein